MTLTQHLTPNIFTLIVKCSSTNPGNVMKSLEL